MFVLTNIVQIIRYMFVITNTLLFKILLLSVCVSFASAKRYKPIWSDLDTRPLPQWFDQAKIGIFIHWGVYSVPSYGMGPAPAEWFWWYLDGMKKQSHKDFIAKNYPPGFTYQHFGPMFTAELFDPDAWAQLFQKSGARYVVLTSKHHDGYCLFPSKRSFSWNSMDVGPKRDIVADLSKAVRARNLTFGLYYSLSEWFHPLYLSDIENGTRQFSKYKVFPEIKQLVKDYKPSILWSDGNWKMPEQFWNSRALLAWLYNDSPVRNEVVTNDRWGVGTKLKHGDFWNGDDAYNPGNLQDHKWEVCFPMDRHSWGYRRDLALQDVTTEDQLLQQIVTAISCGGNALINIGPRKDGTIPLIFQERLLFLGQWLEINGEAIYNSSPWLHQKDTHNENVWYTCIKSNYNGSSPITPSKNDNVTAIYAISLIWPDYNILKLGDVAKVLEEGMRRRDKEYVVTMLGENKRLKYKLVNQTAHIKLPNPAKVRSKRAWTLRIMQAPKMKGKLIQMH